MVWLYGANWAYETSIPVPGPDIATYDGGVCCRMNYNFKMLSSPITAKGGFRIDPSQFPRHSMYKHTTVQKLNRPKKVAVDVGRARYQHNPPPPIEFFDYNRLDKTTDKSSYSNRNSAKQVPQIEGLPEQQQQSLQLGDMQSITAGGGLK
ncbi:MAG: hypothetical protein WAJ93_19665 [Candidatus Nitrosopolaris sp.]